MSKKPITRLISGILTLAFLSTFISNGVFTPATAYALRAPAQLDGSEAATAQARVDDFLRSLVFGEAAHDNASVPQAPDISQLEEFMYASHEDFAEERDFVASLALLDHDARAAAIPVLLRFLDSEDFETVGVAVRCLAALEAHEAIPHFLRIAQRPGAPCKLLAGVLLEMGDAIIPYVASMTARFESSLCGKEEGDMLAEALKAAGPAAAPAIPSLQKAIREGVLYPYPIARTLGAIGPAAAITAPDIVRAIDEGVSTSYQMDTEQLYRILSTLGPGIVPFLMPMITPETASPGTPVSRYEETVTDVECAIVAIGLVAPESVLRIRDTLDPSLSRHGTAAEFSGDTAALVRELSDMFASSNPYVALAAVAALRGLGVQAAPAAPVLIALLGHGSYNILREEAILALAAIGEPALPVLREALSSSDSYLVGSAADAIKMIGMPAVAATPELIAALGRLSEDLLTRMHIKDALSSIGVPAIPRIRQEMEHATQQGDGPLATALGEVLTEIAPTADDIPMCLEFITSGNSAFAGLEGLGSIGPAAANTIPAILDYLETLSGSTMAKETIIYKAGEAFHAMADARAMPVLMNLTLAQKILFIAVLSNTLWPDNENHAAINNLFLQLLRSPDPAIRRVAVESVSFLNNHMLTQEFIGPLFECFAQGDEMLRAAALQGLCRWGVFENAVLAARLAGHPVDIGALIETNREAELMASLGVPSVGGKIQIYCAAAEGEVIRAAFQSHGVRVSSGLYQDGAVITVLVPPAVSARQTYEFIEAAVTSGIIPYDMNFEVQITVHGDLTDEAKYIAIEHYVLAETLYAAVEEPFYYHGDRPGVLIPGGRSLTLAHPAYAQLGYDRTDFRGRIISGGEDRAQDMRGLRRSLGELQWLSFGLLSSLKLPADQSPLESRAAELYNNYCINGITAFDRESEETVSLPSIEDVLRHYEDTKDPDAGPDEGAGGKPHDLLAECLAEQNLAEPPQFLGGEWPDIYRYLTALEALCVTPHAGDQFRHGVSMLTQLTAQNIKVAVERAMYEMHEGQLMRKLFNGMEDCDGSA